MADDARTEAQRRLIEVLAQHPRLIVGDGSREGCLCGWVEILEVENHTHAQHQADAVLALFLNVDWRGSLNGSTGARARQLTLHGPVEPVTEEPKP